ncbi:MAG: hypothetical protein Q8O86_10790, partial [Dehalococcoidia bacterium]|nr:hypothetical protein [Dehalococcoidia bacterium]
MRALGKALWIVLIFVVVVGGSVLAFSSLRSLQAQTAAAPPSPPNVSLNPSLIAPTPSSAQAPTPATVRPTFTPTPSPTPFPPSPTAPPNVSASLYVSQEVVAALIGA